MITVHFCSEAVKDDVYHARTKLQNHNSQHHDAQKRVQCLHTNPDPSKRKKIRLLDVCRESSSKNKCGNDRTNW